MECRECGSKLDHNALFCGVCGSKVEERWNFCKKCGEELKEEAKFCRACGEPVKSEVEVEAGGETVPTFTPKVPGKKKAKKGKTILASLAFIAVVAVLMVTLGGRTKNSKDHMDLIIFEKDYESYYAKSSGEEQYILKAEDLSQTIISQDGKKIYSIDEDKNLYLQQASKDTENIARDVEWAAINPSGDTVVFIKDYDDYNNTGALYVKSGKGDPERVASEGCLHQSVSISQNGKYVIYTEIESIYQEDNGKTYLYPVGGEKENIGKHRALVVNNKGTVLSKNADSDLYIIKKDQEAEKIASNMDRVIVNNDFSKLIILDDLGNLYLYKGKDAEKLESNVDMLADAKGVNSYNTGLVYTTDTQELDILFTKNSDIYIMLDGQKAEKVGSNSPRSSKISEDFRQFAYINDNGLYLKQFKNNKLKVEEKIDSDVRLVDLSRKNNHLAYVKDGNLYSLAKGKKDPRKIDTKDDVIEIRVQNDGAIYYKTYDGRLFVNQGKKESKQIGDDVDMWYVNEKTAYLVDGYGRLYQVTETNKVEKIADDVSNLEEYYMYRYRTQLY